MQIEIKTIVNVSEQNKGLFDIVAKELSCGSRECVQNVISKRSKEDIKSLISNCLYSYFGNAQSDIASGAVGLLDGAITSTVTITDETQSN